VKITIRARRLDDGSYEATVSIPINPGALAGGGTIEATGRGAPGESLGWSLGRAVMAAEKTAEAIESHPEAMALLPPGVPIALAGIKAIAKSGAVGRAAEALHHIKAVPALAGLKRFAHWL
jgi:hypothetical protein